MESLVFSHDVETDQQLRKIKKIFKLSRIFVRTEKADTEKKNTPKKKPWQNIEREGKKRKNKKKHHTHNPLSLP